MFQSDFPINEIEIFHKFCKKFLILCVCFISYDSKNQAKIVIVPTPTVQKFLPFSEAAFSWFPKSTDIKHIDFLEQGYNSRQENFGQINSWHYISLGKGPQKKKLRKFGHMSN